MTRPILYSLLVVLALGCGGGSPTDTGPVPNQAVIQGFAFNPTPLTVAAGATVTWINRDGVTHTTTGGSGPETWDSGSLVNGRSFTHHFTVPGTYQYACSIHPSMHGTIIVN